MDTNCDGTVDWDEYLSYMLLEYREKDQMNMTNAVKPFPKSMRSVANINRYQRFRDSIISLSYIPNLIKIRTSIYKPLDDTQVLLDLIICWCWCSFPVSV